MWCAPWYIGDLPFHAANITDRTVVPMNHTFIQKEGCFEIANVDAQIAQAKVDEKKYQLTSGSSWPPIPGQQ